jgi:uncharacterized protein (DUF2236 family)
MESAHPQTVSREAIESLIASATRTALNPTAGLFGPASITWRINREAALFLAAGRAALLQVAHPWVATALQQHSTLMSRPIARFHSTFRIVFTMVFGSLQQASAAARQLYTTHTYIQGELAESAGRYARGAHYEANEIAALSWVYATLVESAVLAYECVLPPLSDAELAAYYADSRTMAALFGLPGDALPPDWKSFLTYCREMEQSDALGVSEPARSMAHGILAGAGSWIKPPAWYRALTTAWLAPRFRQEFALRFGDAEERAVNRLRKTLPRWYGRMPAALRFVGPWREAQARLQGRSPGFITRVSNRFWIGQTRLPFGTS